MTTTAKRWTLLKENLFLLERGYSVRNLSPDQAEAIAETARGNGIRVYVEHNAFWSSVFPVPSIDPEDGT